MKIILLLAIACCCGLSTHAQSQTELKNWLTQAAAGTKNSRCLIEHKAAQQLIQHSAQSIPFLIEEFTNTASTTVYSDCQQRYLTQGELAIILVDLIESMPYYTLTGVQNCTVTFCSDNPNRIEFYLRAIRRDGAGVFKGRYLAWLEGR